MPDLCGMVAIDSDFGLCRLTTSVWDLHLGRFDFPDFQDLQVQFPERPPMRTSWTFRTAWFVYPDWLDPIGVV